ncbi:sensor histidine kinase [Micropruina glycogenica]|uniref:sensor histidine kinase n=1 Tax=Micropruina glycogenica TaxID=75385 RepID=UPI001319D78F|nr:ATP-binding protein [Micropruina glycogenica]
MSPLVTGVLGAVLGALIAVLVMTLSKARARAATSGDPEPVLPPELLITVEHLRNPAAVLGAHDQLLAESLSAASSGLLRGRRIAQPDVLELVREARRDNEPGVLNIEVATGLGLPNRPLAVRVAPLGEGLVLLVADDRSEALRVDETRRDFVANITHELKTPIGAISLLAEAIADSTDDADAVKHFAGRMSTETARLNELIAQIIALSRLQSTDPLLAAVPIEVDDVIDDVLDQARALADNRGIALTHQRSSEGVVRGDRNHIEAALRNLIQNAIAYSDAGARVAVTTRLVHDGTGDWVEIGVSDNGIGISEADQPRVFERFFRVDYGRSRASGGTGLGLSIVKHVASAHGGTVTLWSRLGQGSTFTLRLPARQPDHHAEGTAA